MKTEPAIYDCTEDDRRPIHELLVATALMPDCKSILLAGKSAILHSAELPIGVRSAIHDFRRGCAQPALLVRGLPLGALPPTPARIDSGLNESKATKSDRALLLISGLLGQPFGWTTIQHGNLINHVLPIAENAGLPISSGYDAFFDYHTEDAYHPASGQYLALLCMRNPSRTPTILSYSRDMSFSNAELRALMSTKFPIRANIAHCVRPSAIRLPIFHGSRDDPFIRFNFNGLESERLSAGQSAAIGALRREVTRVAMPVTLSTGDLLLIDNLRVLHGRPPYEPDLSGKGRWLKRCYISAAWHSTRRYRRHVDDIIIDGNPNAGDK